MKILKFNFFSAIYAVLLAIMAAALIAGLNSCTTEIDEVYSLQSTVNKDSISVGDTHGVSTIALQLPEDPDHYEHEPILIDTTIVDTLVIDTPCIPVEVVDPKFVTLYLEFDVFDPLLLWQGGQVESNNLADVIEAVTSNPYTIYNLGKSWAVIIDNTNDNQSFYLKVFARSNGAKVYMGSIKQGFIFAGALTFDQFKDVAIKYPSVDRFNFRATQYDSLQYIELANIILGDCKAGRTWADFRFNPFEMDPSIITEYQTAGWETVLH